MGTKRYCMPKFLYMFICAFIICIMVSTPVDAAGKAKLTKTRITVTVGKTVKLKVVNNKNKVIWMSKNKKIATVSKSGVVTGKKKDPQRSLPKLERRSLYVKLQ